MQIVRGSKKRSAEVLPDLPPPPPQRLYRVNPVELEQSYFAQRTQRTELPELCDVAICMSGGGSRAYLAALGYFAGLEELGKLMLFRLILIDMS